MSDVPRRIGVLGAIVAFCGGLLAALLCGCPPPVAARRAALCAAASGPLVWICAAVAVGVLQDAMPGRQQTQEEPDGR